MIVFYTIAPFAITLKETMTHLFLEVFWNNFSNFVKRKMNTQIFILAKNVFCENGWIS